MILEAALARQARLLVAGITPQKAKIKNLKKNTSISVVFNPNKIAYSRKVEYEDTLLPDEETGSRTHYKGGSGGTLTMELFFDTTDTGDDVREYTDFLVDLLVRDPKTKQPPPCRFEWGEFSKNHQLFDAVVCDLTIDFTWFLPNGRPVRATTNITFKEPDSQMGGTNPTSRSEARKIWVVVEGQTLDWIAYQEYGRTDAWRHIAATNNLANPKDLRPGMVLKLVPLP